MAKRKLSARLRDPVWIGSRAKNAARRPLFIGFVTVCVVGLAVLSVILAPRHRRRMGPAPSVSGLRIDTVPLIQGLSLAKVRAAAADSALAVARAEVIAANARPQIDSLNPILARRHDSLTNVLTELQDLIGKVENVPLPTSYRALAASPALNADPRILALLDSLRDVEKERDSYGSTEGADPMFVALTSRLTEIGRSIETVAAERRDTLRSVIARMTAPNLQVAEARITVPDTMPWVAERDLAASAVKNAGADLDAARRLIEENRRAAEQAAQISVISASPFAMVVAAAVFGIAFGFAGALRSEIHAPTIADGPELERTTGVRVMASVSPSPKATDTERRKANRIAPRYIDSSSAGYQLSYLHIEQSAATPDIVAIIGDDADVSAIVAMNLAAIAADDARAVLVVDAAGRSEAIKSLLSFSATTELADIIDGRRSWGDATASVFVGRDKTVDVVTGSSPAEALPLMQLLERDSQRLGKDYDAVFVIGSLRLAAALADTNAVGGSVITATIGFTKLSAVIDAIKILRSQSRQVFGAVLWDGAPPRLVARAKRRTGGDRKASTTHLTPQPSAT
jgi:Mrp family chromosome partitioning ATPase